MTIQCLMLHIGQMVGFRLFSLCHMPLLWTLACWDIPYLYMSIIYHQGFFANLRSLWWVTTNQDDWWNMIIFLFWWPTIVHFVTWYKLLRTGDFSLCHQPLIREDNVTSHASHWPWLWHPVMSFANLQTTGSSRP